MELKYIILICVGIFLLFIMMGLAIVNNSGEILYNKFVEFSKYSVDYTPVQFVELINRILFKGKLSIKLIDGKMRDAFESNGTVKLSKDYANAQTLSGITICAHELGHGLQFMNTPKKMQKFGRNKRVSKLLSKFILPLIIVGIIMLFFSYNILCICLISAGVLFFIVGMLFKLSTIKIEKEASSNAIILLRDYASFTEEDLKKAKSFLNSAKLTYVGDFLKSMLKWTMLTRK